MPHQVEVGRCGSIGFRQRIGVQGAAAVSYTHLDVYKRQDLKVKHAEEMRDLRDKQLAAAATMKELDKATGEAWDQVKLTADKVWEDLKTGLSAAQSKFH